MFGGNPGGTVTGDTWEWNGTAWSQVTGSGPSARKNVMMAFDSDRGVTVLFGGFNSGGVLGDTWEWNGIAWVQRTIAGPNPPARRTGSMCFDSARNRVVLYSGLDNSGTILGDTWEYDGSSWTQAPSGGLSARYSSGIAFDPRPGRNVCVLFGGLDSSGYRSDTWEWNGTAWTQRTTAQSPSARGGATNLAYDGSRERIVQFGGEGPGGTLPPDCWEFSGANWTLVNVQNPMPRYGNALAYDEPRSRVISFGGAPDANNAGTKYADLWSYDGTVWSPLVGNSQPSQRSEHILVFDQARKRAVMFGGRDGATGFGDTFEWDGKRWAQYSSGGPSARWGAAAAFHAAAAKTVLFGGRDASSVFSDTWEWNGVSWTQRQTFGVNPSPRFGSAVAYDSARQRYVLFGGINTSGQAVGDTWEFTGGSWMSVGSSGPSPRGFASMTHDPVRSRCVLVGGYVPGQSQRLSDVWEWTGSAWISPQNTGFYRAREGAGFYFDPEREAVTLFGGLDSFSTVPDMTTYSGGTWALQSRPTPQPRYGSPIVYDPVRKTAIMFGGVGYREFPSNVDWGSFADTWEFDGRVWRPVAGTQSPQLRSAHAMVFSKSDQFAILAGGDNGSIRLEDRWIWNNGVWGRGYEGAPPITLAAHAWDESRNRMVLSGGLWSDGSRLGLTYLFSQFGYAPALQLLGAPSARDSSAMAHDSARSQLILYGGTNGSSVFSDTWALRGATWVPLGLPAPGPRRSAFMANDPVRGRVVLFGGWNGSTDMGDTWEFDGTSWTQKALTGPSARRGGMMTFDPGTGKTILCGGVSGSTRMQDVWAWDGTAWAALGNAPWSPRIDMSLIYAERPGQVMLFGGYDGSTFSDLWSYGLCPNAPKITRDPWGFSRSPEAGIVSLSVQAESSEPMTYRWYATVITNGVESSVALNNGDRGGRVSGADTPNLVIANAQPTDTSTPLSQSGSTGASDRNAYFCVVTNSCGRATSARALVTVPLRCPGNMNGDGLINTQDLTLFLAVFAQTVPPFSPGDFDGNGVINVADLTTFLFSFARLCP